MTLGEYAGLAESLQPSQPFSRLTMHELSNPIITGLPQAFTTIARLQLTPAILDC